jgi:hypothetical protein
MKRIKAVGIFCLWALLAFAAQSEQRADHVTQYGITWTFDKEYPVGQFVNGDWWVVGPVQVVSVSPEPGPVADAADVSQKSRYGAAALVSDGKMRNGSMIVEGPDYSDGDNCGFAKQGYDSRVLNYSASRSVKFPCALKANRSLISTISSEKIADGKLSTPDILGQYKIFLNSSAVSPIALETAAILTCLDAIPPPDAFRPAFAGTEKPIYRTSNIRWELLPKLPKLSSCPDWEMMNRIFERSWIDHMTSWMVQHTVPGLNGPHYGREFARMSSLAALMLLQDVPQQTKEPLMIRYLQLGIDLAGLAQNGKHWASDGGHWQGRKWPILFASLMLNDPELRNFPPANLSKPVYGYSVAASDAVRAPTTLFQEDMDFYYGKGGDGQVFLWQIVNHTGAKPPHQERPKASLQGFDKTIEGYYVNNLASGAGVALAAQLMGARALWNKEAFFDHMDWWMLEAEWNNRPKWMPDDLKKTYDKFIEEMWAVYRDDVPEQPKGKDNLKWVWKSDHTGYWETNPPIAADQK